MKARLFFLFACSIVNIFASSQKNESRFQKLLTWLKTVENANVNNDLFEIKRIGGFGMGLVAKVDMKRNTTLFRLKQSTLLDDVYVFDSLFSKEDENTISLLKQIRKKDMAVFNVRSLPLIIDCLIDFLTGICFNGGRFLFFGR
jgi:hypothetical protein